MIYNKNMSKGLKWILIAIVVVVLLIAIYFGVAQSFHLNGLAG